MALSTSKRMPRAHPRSEVPWLQNCTTSDLSPHWKETSTDICFGMPTTDKKEKLTITSGQQSQPVCLNSVTILTFIRKPLGITCKSCGPLIPRRQNNFTYCL